MTLQLPKLYFRKVHKTTKAEFVDSFSGKNCADWDNTPIGDIHIRAGQRVKHWNDMLSDWHYEVIGWNIEGLES